MPFDPWNQRTALVTGASSGLGADFARQLGREGVNLVLVARRVEALVQLRQEIAIGSGVRIDVLPMDLGAPGAPEQLYEAVRAMGLQVDLLINNAGFGLFGVSLDIPLERERAMIELDVLVPLALTRLFGQDMLHRGLGWILQISSVSGFQPVPLYATYGAAKAFILNWGQAVHYEWKAKGVGVTVLAPGFTATEFLKVSGQPENIYQRLVMMDSPTVARIGLQALAQGRGLVVPGWMNKLLLLGQRVLPRACIVPIVHFLNPHP